MKENYIPVFFSSLGTDEKMEKQIEKLFGQEKLSEVYLDFYKLFEIKYQFEKKFPYAESEYGIGGMMYGALETEKDQVLDELKNIISKHNLRDKFVFTKDKIVSKDLLYSEKPHWMPLPKNEYQKKIEKIEFVK